MEKRRVIHNIVLIREDIQLFTTTGDRNESNARY